MVVTPRVVEEVRKHFGCDDLEGAELEDQGEEGTSLTHWEKRVFEVSF
jgi:leishmanolysin-like peptidase